MFKSKHSGWSWDLKRTPFGGGGGWTDPIDWSGAGDALASIDPGPAIGDIGNTIDQNITQPVSQGLSEADTWVNREIPGGWTLPALIAVAYATGYVDPSLLAEVGAEEIGTEAGLEFGTEAGSEIGAEVGSEIGSEVGSEVGGNINSALQGPTYQELGVTGVPEGGMGPTYGEMGFNGLNQQAAIDAANAAAQGGLSASDVLTNANRLKNIAKLLTGSESSPIYGKNTPTANQWATQAAQNFAQATPEQFGGYYQMNKNPFTFANPLASALKGNANGLDVSGTGGTTLQSQNLAKLLA